MKKILLISILSLGFAAQGNAAQWQILGTRAMGMGGAFVGVAEGPVTQYWNPAGLVKHDEDNYSGMAIPVGVNMEVTGKLAENAGKVADMADKFKTLSKKIEDHGKVNAGDVAALTKTLSLLKNIADDGNKGILADINAGAGFKMSKVSVSLNNFTTAGFTPTIDTKNIGLGSTLGSGGSIPGVDIPDEAKTASTPSGYSIQALMIKQALENITADDINRLFNLTGAQAITQAQLENFANWLIQQALLNGASEKEITDAAYTILTYSVPSAEIIHNVSVGDDSTSYKSISQGCAEMLPQCLKLLPVMPGI